MIDLSNKAIPEVKGDFRIVDLVFVDDDKVLIENFKIFMFKDKSIDAFYTPDDFLNNRFQYPKSTKILIDNEFKGYETTGIEIAQKLYEEGFTDFYLYSGREFSQNEIPGYLKVILKNDLETLDKIFK